MTRFGYVMTSYFAVAGIGLSMLMSPSSKLIWNASASVPVGLYALRSLGELHEGELVVAKPPEALAAFMAERRYLPMGVTLIKHILALPGQIVCRDGREILIDGKSVGVTLARDHLGRPLPVWQGCRYIRHEEVFLMNSQSPDSFDGRYFGPLPLASIVGEADPLWTERAE